MANGQFELGPMTDTGRPAVPPGPVPITGDLAARWGWTDPSEEWRNLAMSPKFDETAALAAQMWKAKTGEAVDGVIAIDPIGLQGLVEVSGPVVVDGKLITKDNVVKEILLQSYLDYEVDPNDPNSGQAGTAAATSAAATSPGRSSTSSTTRAGTSPTSSTTSGPPPRAATCWPGRRSPSSSGAGRRPGSPAACGRTRSCSRSQNRAGNKLDQFLPVTADVTHRPVADGTEVTVRIHSRTRRPPRA